MGGEVQRWRLMLKKKVEKYSANYVISDVYLENNLYPAVLKMFS